MAIHCGFEKTTFASHEERLEIYMAQQGNDCELDFGFDYSGEHGIEGCVIPKELGNEDCGIQRESYFFCFDTCIQMIT